MGQIQGRRLPEGDREEARGREGPNDGTLGKAGPQHESGSLDSNPSSSLFTFYQRHKWSDCTWGKGVHNSPIFDEYKTQSA